MTTTRTPRCFYCDSLVADKDALVVLSTGKVYGPCCADLATHAGPHRHLGDAPCHVLTGLGTACGDNGEDA